MRTRLEEQNKAEPTFQNIERYWAVLATMLLGEWPEAEWSQ